MTYSCIWNVPRQGQPSDFSLPNSPCLPHHRPLRIECEKDNNHRGRSSLCLQLFLCMSSLLSARPRRRKLFEHSCASTFRAGHPSRPQTMFARALNPSATVVEEVLGPLHLQATLSPVCGHMCVCYMCGTHVVCVVRASNLQV